MVPAEIDACFERILSRLVESARDRYAGRLVSVAVFGSVGRGEPRADSDIDLLLVVDPLPDGRIRRVREFDALERDLLAELEAARLAGVNTRLSPVIRTRREIEAGSALLLDMTEDARILHDTGGFLASCLDDLAGRLRRLGSRRVRRGSAWYWDLKPDLEPGEIFEI